MAKIGNVDLGNVESVDNITTRNQNTFSIPGADGAFHPDTTSYKNAWRITGHLKNPTQEEREAVLNLQNGEVMLVDINAFNLFGYGKIRDVHMTVDNVWANIYHYSIEVLGCPAIGHTHVHTDDVYLHDMDYRMSLKSFDPHFKHFNVNYSSDRLEVDYQFYLDNDLDSIQDAVFEIQCADGLHQVYLYYYNGADWGAIGTWGSGATAWGGTLSFVDPGTVGHNAIVHWGIRGQARSFGTVSYGLGCNLRILCLIGSLSAHSATDKSTDYDSDQLLLKAKLKHYAAESGVRDYARITYIDGSLDYVIA